MKHKYHSGNGPRDDFTINPHSEAHQERPNLDEVFGYNIGRRPEESEKSFLDRLEDDFPQLRDEMREEREALESERRDRPAKEREPRIEPSPPQPSKASKPSIAGKRIKLFDVERNPGKRIVRGPSRKPSDIKTAK